MRARWPDVVILDGEMPNTDLATFVRRIMLTHPTPVIVCASDTSPQAPLARAVLAAGAAALVARVKEEYGALLSGICYRIENPALFDPADTAAKRLATALIRWDDGQGRLDPSELSVAAAEVRVAFDAAKSHAETVGMAYLPKGAQPKAQTALKAARLARSTKAPAERAAALRQVSAILDNSCRRVARR